MPHLEAVDRDGSDPAEARLIGMEWRRISGRTSAGATVEGGGGEAEAEAGEGGSFSARRPAASLDSWRK